MSFRCICFLALVLILSFKAEAQSAFPARGSSITVDRLGGIYVFSPTVLSIYNQEGALQARFSTLYEQKISAVDASNPFKILLFDRENQTLMHLDNKLSPAQSALDLRDIQIYDALAVATAPDNGFWILEQAGSNLVQFDKYLNRTISQGIGIKLNSNDQVWMQASSKSILIYSSGIGLVVCDEYGNILRTVKLPGLLSPCSQGNSFYGMSKGNLLHVNTTDGSVSESRNLLKEAISFSVAGEKLVILKESQVEITTLHENH